MLSTVENRSRNFADISHLAENVATHTASMGTPLTSLGDTVDELRYPPLYGVEDYICLHLFRIRAHGFAIMPTDKAFTMPTGLEEQ